MRRLLAHQGVAFEDQTVYVAGNAYINCVFKLCTLVVRHLSVIVITGCEFHGCVWHLDVVVHDYEEWDEFAGSVLPMITQTLPRESEVGGGGQLTC